MRSATVVRVRDRNPMEIADDLGHRSWRLLPYGRPIRELSRGGTSRRVHGRGPNSPPPSCHQSGNTHNSYNGAEIADPSRRHSSRLTGFVFAMTCVGLSRRRFPTTILVGGRFLTAP